LTSGDSDVSARVDETLPEVIVISDDEEETCGGDDSLADAPCGCEFPPCGREFPTQNVTQTQEAVDTSGHPLTATTTAIAKVRNPPSTGVNSPSARVNKPTFCVCGFTFRAHE
jgi:hypothetical protein